MVFIIVILIMRIKMIEIILRWRVIINYNVALMVMVIMVTENNIMSEFKDFDYNDDENDNDSNSLLQ